MLVINNPEEMRQWSRERRREGSRIALVPTMGCLHEGHLSLIRLAREEADAVVVSIFVNPIQFGPAEDLEKYPRPFDADLARCRELGVAAVFAPAAGGLYAEDHSVFVEETEISTGLCGRTRPGHFRGVTTVVCKLFNLVQPDTAVFGRKDAQQALIIQRMVRDLNIPVRIITGPVVREKDGLAMSSRNRYLAPEERRQAAFIYQGLLAASAHYQAGHNDGASLLDFFRDLIAEKAPDALIEYAALVDGKSLQPVEKVTAPAMLAVAVRVGDTRLIDNIQIG